MIDTTHESSIICHAEILEISRASVYYLPRPTSEADLSLMRRIDELHLAHSFAVAWMRRDLLRQEGHQVGRKYITLLMRQMGKEACNISLAYYRANQPKKKRDNFR
jgi:putative transposase